MVKKSKAQALVVYMPVVHAGFVKFLQQWKEVPVLFLVDQALLTDQFKSIAKDIRALSADQISQSLKTLHIPQSHVEVLKYPGELTQLTEYDQLVLPEDEVLHWLIDTYIPDHPVVFDDAHFLRWDKPRSLVKRHVEPDTEVTSEQLHQTLMSQAVAQTERSGDWWRQVGGILVKDGHVLLAGHNRHVPHEFQQYVMGDPRGNFSSGEWIELTTSMHAEQALIARAAAEGIALAGADLYATTFPCPFCAKLIAYSGIQRVFYREGYSMLDGVDILRHRGVKLIKVI